MTTSMKVENPDSVTVTLSLTMTLKEWQELRDQLTNDWPSWRVSGDINNMLGQVRQTFYPAPSKIATP